MASRLLIGAPKSLNNSTFSRLQTTVDPTAPRKIIFGKTAGGNDERFHELTNKHNQAIETSENKSDYLHKVIALASHKVHSIDAIYLEDQLSYNGSTVVGPYSEKSGFAVTAIKEGKASNAAPFASGGYWTSTSKFTGCAYVKLKFRLHPDVYPDGIPSKLITVVSGCPVYDPRLDSLSGGLGGATTNDDGEVIPPIEEHVDIKERVPTGKKTLAKAAGNRFAVRYDELNLFIAAAQEQRLAALEAML